MVIGNDIFDTVEAALLEADEKVLPRRAALAVGELYSQNLAPAFPVHTQCDEYGAGAHHACLADFLIFGIDDEVGERLVQPTSGKGCQALVQSLVDR